MERTVPATRVRDVTRPLRRVRVAVLSRTEMARAGLTLLAVIILLAGIVTTINLLRQTPRLGMIIAGNGRVILLDPDGAAARSGIAVGDAIAAVGGDAVRSAGFSALARAGTLIPVSEGTPGSFALFWLRVAPPSQTELAGDIAALAAALALWCSGLLAGLPRRRDRASRLYGLAALCAALALCAIIARDGSLLWPWFGLLPALIAGLAALLLSQCALIGFSKYAPAIVTLLTGLCVLLSLLDMAITWPTAIVTGLGAVPGILAVAALLAPIILHARTDLEPQRRRLRVILLANIVGLLPVLLWPGRVMLAGILGLPASSPSPAHLSSLWSTTGLIPMAALYNVALCSSNPRRTDALARGTLSYLTALAFCASGAVALLPGQPQAGRNAIVLALLVLFPVIQQAAKNILDRTAARPQPDYAAALRIVEETAARAAHCRDLVIQAVGRLPPLLQVRSCAILLRGLGCSDDRYRLFHSDGRNTVVRLDETLEKTAPEDAPPVSVSALTLSPDGRALVHALGAALWVPLWWNGQQRGVLILGPLTSGDPFEEQDILHIAAIANVLALACHTFDAITRLHDRSVALSRAHEQERAHISHELHDVVAQELIALTRQLRRYNSEHMPPPDIWADMLAAAQDALTATRRICNGLRPAILDLGLVPALRDLVADTQDRAEGTEIMLSVEGETYEQRLAAELEFALFRVAQEGINNALKHAGASAIAVDVQWDVQELRLRVRDNGRGFVVPARFEDLPGDHLGLIGMRERLADYHGTLTISSAPGQGTTLEARVPTTLDAAQL